MSLHTLETKCIKNACALQLPVVHVMYRNAMQICIKWGLQHGTSVIPRAEIDEHVVGNLDVYDWQLSPTDYEVCSEVQQPMH